MLFHSLTFLVFILIVYGLLIVFSKNKIQKPILLVASYVFYMWWNPALIILVIYSTLVDYLCGLKINNSKFANHKKRWLWLSIAANLLVLFFFKYFNFFQDTLFYFQQEAGFEPSWTMTAIILPLGISFYTFQSMSYTIDVYRGKLNATLSFFDFALYISFFPQMIAGPIIRAVEFLPQLLRDRNLNFSKPVLLLFAKGLFKKVIIADNINFLTAGVYGDIEAQSAGMILLSSIFCYVQVYCDFSGYSDMAIALGRSMGFNFPENFKKPYHATSLSEFWRRWHITLSTWFRDYIYFPLGGNLKNIMFNVFIVMFVSGLWHGANLNFVVWGIFHGVLLIIDKKLKIKHFGRAIGWIFTQCTFMFLLVLFWASNDGAMNNLWNVFTELSFSLKGIGYLNIYLNSALLFIFVSFYFFFDIEKVVNKLQKAYYLVFWIGYGMIFYLFAPTYEQPFIYFQF